MAVNLGALPELFPVPGIRLGTVAAGLRKKDRRDLVVIECNQGTRAAATFTRNRFCAAPVMVAREHLQARAPRALLINTGCANAGTGPKGVADARATCEELARLLNCQSDEILPFSTGVIGERLPLTKLLAGLPGCIVNLSPNGWADAAHGIMTTDTLPKGSSRRVRLSGGEVTITGIAKGAGMIRPDMATMLAFVATDVFIAPALLQACVSKAVTQSFNRITIDGDTSTNDACVLLSTGAADHAPIQTADSSDYSAFSNAVTETFTVLAHAIVRDAEGATKFMTVHVEQGRSEADCLEVAYAIAHSPLVKTAFFASDPNWGRILAAVGRAPIAALDVGRVSIYLNDVCIVHAGGVAPDYSEAKGQAEMKKTEITVRVQLGAGTSSARVWTSDLSHDYVSINADYRS